ncbi:MAG: CPBP family intramembrane metalloprotease [Oscillospiraceae bacterium]|nr:CPBP family intramembrane metalloprotease [Oscillospiraceae bacterium]
MKDWKLSQTQPQFERIRRLPEQRVSKHIIILLLLSAAMWLGGQIGMAVFSIPFSVIFSALGVPLLGNPTIGMIITLFLTIVTVLLTYVLIGPIERRTLRTAGLTKHRCVRDYLTGGTLGFVMFTIVILMAWATGAVRPAAPDQDRNILLMILMFGGWMVQGFSEEFLCRGFLMMSTGTHHKPWLAVFISSTLFGLGHVFNAGASVAGVLNVILFGVTMGVIMLRTDSIWVAAALHSVWNWAQGSFFGLQVSGNAAGASVLRFEQTGAANWMGGGAFGLEAGLGTTLINVVVLLVFLLVIPQRTSDYPPAALPAEPAPAQIPDSDTQA